MSSLARFLEGWSTFYTAMVGGTTVLMGLVFLAVSLRLEVFTRGGLHEPREVAWQTFINFFWVFVISLVFLIPGASGTALAVILTSLSVAGLFLVLRRWRRAYRRIPLRRSIAAFLPLLLCYFVLAVSSAWSFFDFRSLAAVAPVLVFLVGIAVYNAWE